jgi:hypothetical protein
MKFVIPKDIPAVSWSWQEGRYWDLWMIVHTLTGTICACVVALLDLPPMYAYLLVLLALTVYELGEMAAGIVEEIENWVLDVLFGMFGFWFVYEKVLPDMSFIEIAGVGGVLLFFNAIFAFMGWRAYRKRVA